MILVKSLAGALLLIVSLIRIYLNARIYNRIHGTNQEVFYPAKNQHTREINKTNESGLFTFYCLIIVVWFRMSRNTLFPILINFFLSLISIGIIWFFISY